MIPKLKHILIAAGLLFMAFFAQRCANAVAPTGGPKDETPPKVVQEIPENHCTNFTSKKIEITFDEYITLENANQNVLISPPLSEKPDIKLHNKTVTVKFKETLAANTTYTINFGSAIKDLHEGNPFTNYVYSFSTGDYIDTLCIAGKVLYAEDKKPVENTYVSLYAADRDNLDSLPMTVAPNYITKTDKEGNFRLEGLADKKYLVFAIKDVNSNLYFDQPNEEVAFLDTLVAASIRNPIPNVSQVDSIISDTLSYQIDSLAIMLDSIAYDTLKNQVDSLAIKQIEKTFDSIANDTLIKIKDSLAIKPKFETEDSTAFFSKAAKMYNPDALNLTLYMFTEIDSTQMLLEKKLVEEGLLRFVFRHPAKEAVVMTPEMLPDTFNLVTIRSANYDTVWWYFTPNVKDSLWVHIKYDTVINDSSRYNLKFKDKNARNKKPENLKVTNNLHGRSCLIPGEDLILKFSEPVVSYQMSDSSVFKRDTLVSYGELAFGQIDEYGLEYKLLTEIEDNVNYNIELPDSVFFGIRGRTNTSIQADFHRMKDDEFGNIYITVIPPEGMKQVVVQLLNEAGKVLEEQAITTKEEVMFEYLQPAKYKLRALLDADGNGKWSTGNYHRRVLPETVVDYKDVLEIRAGWDVDLSEPWEL